MHRIELICLCLDGKNAAPKRGDHQKYEEMLFHSSNLSDRALGRYRFCAGKVTPKR